MECHCTQRREELGQEGQRRKKGDIHIHVQLANCILGEKDHMLIGQHRAAVNLLLR